MVKNSIRGSWPWQLTARTFLLLTTAISCAIVFNEHNIVRETSLSPEFLVKRKIVQKIYLISLKSGNFCVV